MAFMLARQQIFLELDEEMEDYDELVEILSNSLLNSNFLSLAREVSNTLGAAAAHISYTGKNNCDSLDCICLQLDHTASHVCNHNALPFWTS